MIVELLTMDTFLVYLKHIFFISIVSEIDKTVAGYILIGPI
jgi:hypothetical protein